VALCPTAIAVTTTKFGIGWFEMSDPKPVAQTAHELCEKALHDARAELHPLLRSVDVNRLEKRNEFIEAFRSALEKQIAKRLAVWQPSIQSVFRFDESHANHDPSWDGKIHLLVKVPRVSDAIKSFGRTLDKYLLGYLSRHLGWSRFQDQGSILDVQQVTINELRHGVSYGAMFHAVYSVPVKVWPLQKTKHRVPNHR
jgi:hypothetical protein